MGKIIEGVWDCAYCGTKKIKGSVRICPNCGRQRDSNITFYIDDPNNYVPEEKEIDINKNPDWICSYCDGLVSDSEDVCPNCGALRDDSVKNYFEHKDEIDLRRKKRQDYTSNVESNDCQSYCLSDCDNDSTDNNDYSLQHQSCSNDIRTKKLSFDIAPKSKIVKSVISVFLCIAILIGFVFLLSPKTYDVVVNGFTWERSIDIEEYVTVERDGWSLPSEARLLKSQTEIRSYKDVIDHYETKTRTYSEQELDHYEIYVSGHRDLGNGYFEEITSERPVYKTVTKTETYQEPVYRSEPVYDTKYYYEIDIWQHCRYVNSSGSNQIPVWGKTDLKELEREGKHTEKYMVHVHNITKNKDDIYTFDYDVWKNLELGEELKIKVKFNGDADLIVDNDVLSTVASN